MKTILDCILNHPRKVLLSLFLIVIVCVWGITFLQFENSYETGMPEGDQTFLLGEAIKKEFKDTETYLLISIEPARGKKLLSTEVFTHLYTMVKEINEYRVFDREREDRRLETIMRKGGVTIIPENTDHVDEDEPSGAPEESEFDQPIRKRNVYDYSSYTPVSFNDLKTALDPLGREQLRSIKEACDVEIQENKNLLKLLYDYGRSLVHLEVEEAPSSFADDENLTLDQYRKILEAWEDLFLFKSLEIVEVFSNPIEMSDILGTNDTLRSVDLIEEDESGGRIIPTDEKGFDQYRKKLFRNPVFKWNYYSQDDKDRINGLASSILLRRQKYEQHDRFMKYLWAIVHKYNNGPVQLLMQGGLVFDKFINEYNQRDLEKYIPMVLFIIIITFYLNFRTIRGVILPTFTVIISTIITMGVMGFLGIKLTIVSTILPPLLIAIGSSYSIHIFNQYLLDLETIHREGKKEGLKKAMLHISNTVFLTGLTTFISFMTLVVNRIPALSDFGYSAAFGTAVSVAVSICFIVSTLIIMKALPFNVDSKKGKQRKPNVMVMLIVRFFSVVSVRYYRLVILITMVSIVISVIGITKMTTETSATSYFKPDSYIRVSLDRTNELFKGTYIVNLVFSRGEGKSILDADFLRYMEEVREWLNRPGQDTEYRILYNSGFGDFIKRMNMAMNNENPEYYSIPDTMTVIDYMELFGGTDEDFDGRPDMFESTINAMYDKTNLMVRIGTLGGELMTTKKTEITLNHIREYLENKPNPHGYTYLITGGPTNFLIVSDYIVRGQIKTIFISLMIIAMVMLFLFRNTRAGIVSVLPVSCTIFWVFGFMGFYGIPLGMAQSLISCIAIGIGIDDTVHFMNTLRKNLSRGMDLPTAIQTTHHEAGLAIVYTSVAIVFGFSVLMLSHFSPVAESGMLVTGVMVTSTIADLLMLPSIIMLFKIHIHEVQDWKIFRILRLHKLLIQYEPEEN